MVTLAILVAVFFAVAIWYVRTLFRVGIRAPTGQQLVHDKTALDCVTALNPKRFGKDETQLFLGLILLHNSSGFNIQNLNSLIQDSCSIEKYAVLHDVVVFRCISHRRRLQNVVLSDASGFSVTQRWDGHWNTVSYVICGQKQCCYWPNPPDRERKTTGDRTNVINSSETRVVLASDYMDNIWHAANVMNMWCEMRRDDALFAGLTSGNEFAPYVYTWLKNVNIATDRLKVVSTDTLLLAKEVVLTPRRIDWSCLHRLVSRPTKCLTRIVVMYRSTVIQRDIPLWLHVNLVERIQKQFPSYTVTTFYGNETFEETQRIFGNAAAVIGPHGAAFVNVVFCSSRALILEFMTDEVLRPWQLLGGFSIGLTWLPVLLSSYSDELGVLSSIEILYSAFDISFWGERSDGCTAVKN